MEQLENKFLQRVDLDKLQKETGKTLEQIAELAEVGHKVIYKWAYMHKDSSRPSYNTIIKLLECGATVETLFGVEYKAGIKVVEKPIKLTALDVSEVLAMASEALKKNPQ